MFIRRYGIDVRKDSIHIPKQRSISWLWWTGFIDIPCMTLQINGCFPIGDPLMGGSVTDNMDQLVFIVYYVPCFPGTV